MPSSSIDILDLNEPQAITFAPNMTEATFQNQDEPEGLESDLLFPPAEIDSNDDSSVSKRIHHGKRKDKDHIPRPPNAFILFRSSFIKQQHIPGTIEGNHSQLSKIVGACWQRLSFEERQVWEKRAKVARLEHKKLYPDYKFVRSRNAKATTVKEKSPHKFVNTVAVTTPVMASPVGSKTPTMVTTTTQSLGKQPRRKNTPSKTADDPRRCEQIARLLVAGHKGSSLEAMVQKLDAATAQAQNVGGFNMTELQTPERVARGSVSRGQIVRRSSSCPPLDIPAALLARIDTTQSPQAPSRRQKPLRGTATSPYPLSSVKYSRSVSPPLSPGARSMFDATPQPSPIEGPFSNSSFNFGATMPATSPTAFEPVAPHDTTYCDFPSPSPTINSTYYQWPSNTSSVQVTESYGGPFTDSHTADAQLTPSFHAPQPLSQSSSCSDLSSMYGAIDEAPFWGSDFEWIPLTEDETGSSSAPPSTPGASSPMTTFSGHLPLDEIPQHAAYDELEPFPTPAVDLNNYAKGLRLFTAQPNPFSVQSIRSPQSDVYSPVENISPQTPYHLSCLDHSNPGNTNASWNYSPHNATPKDNSLSHYTY